MSLILNARVGMLLLASDPQGMQESALNIVLKFYCMDGGSVTKQYGDAITAYSERSVLVCEPKS